MRLTGCIFDVEGLDEYSFDVHEAVVTQERIALDWKENGEVMHAVLESIDGGYCYKGHFGRPRPDSRFVMEAHRYNSCTGDVLLWVRWHETFSGHEGQCIIELASDWE